MSKEFAVFFGFLFLIVAQRVATTNPYGNGVLTNNSFVEETLIDGNDLEAINLAAFKTEINDLKETLNEVLNKQISLETVFQLILESSEKNSTAEFIKAQFDELKNFLKAEKFENFARTPNELPLHDEHLSCLQNCNNSQMIFNNCLAALTYNGNKEGVYLLNIANGGLKPFYAYCQYERQFDWLIIQRREDGTENFYRNWNDYKKGFGNAFREYWIGLERLHAMTKKTPLELLIVMEDYTGRILHENYYEFRVGSESEGYILNVNLYTEDSSSIYFTHFNGMKFSTYDRDNDNSNYNCARKLKSAWWFNGCSNNLNGRYYSYADSYTPNGTVWGQQTRSLKSVFMAVRMKKN